VAEHEDVVLVVGVELLGAGVEESYIGMIEPKKSRPTASQPW
jgi:hypothetical protein